MSRKRVEEALMKNQFLVSVVAAIATIVIVYLIAPVHLASTFFGSTPVVHMLFAVAAGALAYVTTWFNWQPTLRFVVIAMGILLSIIITHWLSEDQKIWAFIAWHTAFTVLFATLVRVVWIRFTKFVDKAGDTTSRR